jgi:predicted ATP-dependent protease
MCILTIATQPKTSKSEVKTSNDFLIKTERILRVVEESKCYKRSQHATAQMCILTIANQPKTSKSEVKASNDFLLKTERTERV